MYIVWMLLELKISQKDVRTDGRKTADSGTCQLYGLGQALTILTALWFPSLWERLNAAHFFGFALFLFGVAYRQWSVRELGEYYSHLVCTVENHKIVDSGPYRLTRHPAYAGMIVANAGVCLFFFNWITFGIFAMVSHSGDYPKDFDRRKNSFRTRWLHGIRPCAKAVVSIDMVTHGGRPSN